MQLGFQEWEYSSLCSQKTDWDWFTEDQAETNICVSICMECPVRKECLSFALQGMHTDGIFGGKTEKELRILQGVDEFKEYHEYETLAFCGYCASSNIFRPAMKDRQKVKRGFVWIECADCGMGWSRMETQSLGIYATPSKSRALAKLEAEEDPYAIDIPDDLDYN